MICLYKYEGIIEQKNREVKIFYFFLLTYTNLMRLHRFFIDEQMRNKTEISVFDDAVIHQWKDVFRLRSGDKLILLDNTGFEYLTEIVVLAKGKADLKILDRSICEASPEKDIWLYAAVIKKDNYEWILEKGTEVGVSHFVPVVSDRSEKKNLNMERARKILKEASEQSGRGIMPSVEEPVDLKTAISQATVPLLAFHMSGEKFVADFHNSKQKLGILIGPEGGWSDNELALFKEKEIPVYSVGNLVLRAETAAIVISALFNL
jgi:16S rRNA (uracil1498-N3)-methyltransferase